MMIEPKLRFKADDGSDFPDWEEQKIEDVCVLNPRTEQLDDEFYYMDLGSIDHGRWEAPEIVNKVDAPSRAQRVAAIDDVFFQSVRPYNMGHYHYVAAKDKQVVASTGYIQARMRNGSNAFLYQLFYEERFNAEVNARCTGSNYPAINSRKFGEITVALPSLPEQRKIADLLSAVDDVISAQEAEVAAWEKRKKGVMQKLFSQEVRFKADDGSDFPDWEEKTLGDVGSVAMCKRVFKEQTREVGDVPFFKIGTFGDVPDAYISKSLFDELKSKYAYPKVGTILLSASGTIGRQVEYNGEDAYYQDSNIVWLEHDDTVLDSYLKQFYSVVKWQGLEGSTIKRLYNKTILDTPFYRPSLPEQRKIAECLALLDDVIAKAKDELDAWRELKKGLLQQMFV